jgi:hypothetical protein
MGGFLGGKGGPGGLVNSENELIAGLERGQIGGIGLDVWENEGGSCNPVTVCGLEGLVGGKGEADE